MKSIFVTTDLDYQTSCVTGWNRQHWQEAGFLLLQGITQHLSREYSLNIKEKTNKGKKSDIFEGFSRSFVLFAILIRDSENIVINEKNKSFNFQEIYFQGILNGTNPQNPQYWGDINDYSQNIVECASLAWSLYLSREYIWQKYTPKEKQQIVNYLLQCNKAKSYSNNWLLFNVIINKVLEKLGMKFSNYEINKNLKQIEKMYVGEGWYQDGGKNQFDYYNAWGFHYYLLIWIILDSSEKSNFLSFSSQAQVYLIRVQEWLNNFLYFMSKDGNIPCFGRSSAYRFAYLAPISLGLYLNCWSDNLGEIKTFCNLALKFFCESPILTEDNLLNSGYFGYCPELLEPYSCQYSSYFAVKAFHLLLLPQSHTFWQKSEKELPIHKRDFSKEIKSAGFLVLGNSNSGHIQLISQKSYHPDPRLNIKYTKFAYSSIFGFDLSLDQSSKYINQGYEDNALIFSDGDEYYYQRCYLKLLQCQKNFIVSEYPLVKLAKSYTPLWQLFFSVMGKVKTYIFVKDDFMINIHLVKTSKKLNFREGGYPLGYDDQQPDIISDGDIEGVYQNGKFSIIRNLYGYNAKVYQNVKKTKNIRHSYSLVPAFQYNYQGDNKFYLASMIYGGIGDVNINDIRKLITYFTIENDVVTIIFYDQEKVIKYLE